MVSWSPGAILAVVAMAAGRPLRPCGDDRDDRDDHPGGCSELPTCEGKLRENRRGWNSCLRLGSFPEMFEKGLGMMIESVNRIWHGSSTATKRGQTLWI